MSAQQESIATTADADCNSSRRRFLSSSAFALAPLALQWLLKQDEVVAAPAKAPNLQPLEFSLESQPAHFEPRATAMISLFMQGGPSQVDLLDPKPILNKLDGQKFPGSIKYDNAAQASTKVLGSPWKFAKHGECGTPVSELLPGIAGVVDDICVIRSMHTGVNNHGQSIHALNSGRTQRGRPSLGAWLTYGLGAETQNLPAYVAMSDPRGIPVEGVLNWSNGWLPSLFQGTVIRPREPRILNLEPPPQLRGKVQQQYLAYLRRLNEQHQDEHPSVSDLSARISNYELAARMQTAAREALDISKETKATQQMYGIDQPDSEEYGMRCLIARRLVERGVRFVQVYHGSNGRAGGWDSHGKLKVNHTRMCQQVDQPIGALLKDLKQRGLLDETLVVWATEFGRTPGSQNGDGRDHHPFGFSVWMAGGGIKGGVAHGATDELGFHAVEHRHYVTDIHATVLKQLGLDPRQLVVPGRKRLERDFGKPIQKIIA